MDKIKIFVACHKPDYVYRDDVYTPIHVGRSLSKYKEELKDMIGDDTGDNISRKNPRYCEMTAHYWIWRNVKDVEYVGLCHYRRYFEKTFSIENIDKEMNGFDVIMINPLYIPEKLFYNISVYFPCEDFLILKNVILKLYPNYYKTFIRHCSGLTNYPFNMLVCRKSEYDKYAEWIFSILTECEKYIRESPYTNANRSLAYLSEMITPIYFIHNNKRIKKMKYFKIEGKDKILVSMSVTRRIRYYAHCFIFNVGVIIKRIRKDKHEIFDIPAVENGLKLDNIDVFK